MYDFCFWEPVQARQLFRKAQLLHTKPVAPTLPPALDQALLESELASARSQLASLQSQSSLTLQKLKDTQDQLEEAMKKLAAADEALADSAARLDAARRWRELFVPELHTANARRFAAEERLYRANLPKITIM